MKNKTKLPGIFLGVVLVVMYLPILMVVLYSFNEGKLIASWKGFSLDWYVKLFQDEEIWEAVKNSLILGVLSCFAAAVLGTVGAVGMAKVKSRTKGPMEYILGMVFLTFFHLLNLPNGMVTLVIAHTAFCIPYIYMMVKARLVGLDKALEEAAKDLGATPLRTFFDITLPLILPAVASGCLLAFAMSWDDVIISILYPDEDRGDAGDQCALYRDAGSDDPCAGAGRADSKEVCKKKVTETVPNNH